MGSKEFFISWDFALSLLIAVIGFWIVPDIIPTAILKELYAISVSVLSILFSMFFASLTIIISLNDNEFLEFLEEDGHFSALLAQFKFSLSVMFMSLIVSLLLYILVIFNVSTPFWGQCKIQVSIFVFIFFYSLFAVFLASLDTIRFLKTRVTFKKKNR